MKYIRIFAVLLSISLLFVGCKKNEDPKKPNFPQISFDQIGTEPVDVTYTHHGISMTLPPDFSDYSQTPIGQKYRFLYGAPTIGISGEDVAKDSVGEEITSLELYAGDYAENLRSEAVQKDGIWTVQYEDLSQNEPQMYVCALYETEESYWVISCYCPSQVFESYSQDIWRYVTSAVFE